MKKNFKKNIGLVAQLTVRTLFETLPLFGGWIVVHQAVAPAHCPRLINFMEALC